MSQTALMSLRAVINGHPVFAELEEFTPVEIKKVMEESRGGKFISDEIMVGIEKMSFEIKLIGASADLLKEYGVMNGSLVQVDVLGSQKEANTDRALPIRFEHSAELTSIKEEAVKQGAKPTVTISGSVKVYKKMYDGKVLFDINTKTQVINLGQGDIMAEHRRNVGLA